MTNSPLPGNALESNSLGKPGRIIYFIIINLSGIVIVALFLF
jgi:hypothetical protein